MPGKRKLFLSSVAMPASSSTAMRTSHTPLSGVSWEASPTLDRPAFPSSAFWWSTRSTANSSTCLLAGVKKLKTGDPLDESTDLGPLIRESDAVRASDWVQEAVRGGARLLCGGGRKGSMLEPTVLTGTRPDMKVNCQEIFAPVVTVEPYNEFDEALRQINKSRLWPAGGIVYPRRETDVPGLRRTRSRRADRRRCARFRIDHMPYGGVKDSGLGREGLRYAIEEMTEPKLHGDESSLRTIFPSEPRVIGGESFIPPVVAKGCVTPSKK